jgi:hypothetical protein
VLVGVGVAVGVNVAVGVGVDVSVGCAASVAATTACSVDSKSGVGVLPQAANKILIKTESGKSLFISQILHSATVEAA